jgi:Fic family protein
VVGSLFLKARRIEYYDRLTAIRFDGDWEGWLKFFLKGVYEVSVSATSTARRILELRESHRKLLENPDLLEYLFEQPIVSISMVKGPPGLHLPDSRQADRALCGSRNRSREHRPSTQPPLSL